MDYDIDKAPVIVRTAATVTAPAGDVSAAEWSEYKNRVVAIEGLGLVDLSDVEMTALEDGVTLVYNAADDVWRPGTTVGTLESVRSNWDTYIVDDVSLLTFGPGLYVDPAYGTPRAHVTLVYGSAANTVAAGNHTHSIRPDTQLTFAASGSFSSGTRTLVSGTVTGLDPAKTYVLRGVLDVQLRGDGTGAGYTLPRITINGVGVNMPERPRNVAGVQPCYTMRHPGVSVTGVSSVAVSATIAYSEGDPTWVGGGALTVSVEANR